MNSESCDGSSSVQMYNSPSCSDAATGLEVAGLLGLRSSGLCSSKTMFAVSSGTAPGPGLGKQEGIHEVPDVLGSACIDSGEDLSVDVLRGVSVSILWERG